MHGGILFLVGFLVGGVVIYILVVIAYRRAVYRRYHDEQRIALRAAVVTHFRSHGTLNLAHMERIMDAPNTVAVRYLSQLERDGVIRRHSHSGGGVFFTLVR